MRFTTPISLSVLSLALVLAACNSSAPTADTLDSTQDSSTAASQQSVIPAGPFNYLGGTVTAWSDLAREEIGFTLPLSVIQNAVTTIPAGTDPHISDPKNSVRIELPAQVKAATFLDHIQVDYNPVGHEPVNVYTVPHFDFHFYGITSAEQDKIDCTDTSTIATDRIPKNYIVAKPGVPPAGECVPQMGLHAVDITSPEVNPQKPVPFSKTMILGYYQGRMTFVEPMITREQLLKKQDFTMVIPHAEVVARDTLLPSKFTATFDAAKQEYRFTVSEFVEVE